MRVATHALSRTRANLSLYTVDSCIRADYIHIFPAPEGAATACTSMHFSQPSAAGADVLAETVMLLMHMVFVWKHIYYTWGFSATACQHAGCKLNALLCRMPERDLAPVHVIRFLAADDSPLVPSEREIGAIVGFACGCMPLEYMPPATHSLHVHLLHPLSKDAGALRAPPQRHSPGIPRVVGGSPRQSIVSQAHTPAFCKRKYGYLETAFFFCFVRYVTECCLHGLRSSGGLRRNVLSGGCPEK